MCVWGNPGFCFPERALDPPAPMSFLPAHCLARPGLVPFVCTQYRWVPSQKPSAMKLAGNWRGGECFSVRPEVWCWIESNWEPAYLLPDKGLPRGALESFKENGTRAWGPQTPEGRKAVTDIETPEMVRGQPVSRYEAQPFLQARHPRALDLALWWLFPALGPACLAAGALCP